MHGQAIGIHDFFESSRLCQIIVRLAVLAPLQILPLDEVLNPLLNVQRFRLEARTQLSCHFVDELVVRHVFAILHNADDASLSLMTPFLINVIKGCLAFFRRLHFRSDGADLDPR